MLQANDLVIGPALGLQNNVSSYVGIVPPCFIIFVRASRVSETSNRLDTVALVEPFSYLESIIISCRQYKGTK